MCFVITFDWTFKYTGSTGARLRDPDTIEEFILPDDVDENYNGTDHKFLGNFYSKFLYDNLFNIILVMILLNMIQGIIIDTFGQLREDL